MRVGHLFVVPQNTIFALLPICLLCRRRCSTSRSHSLMFASLWYNPTITNSSGLSLWYPANHSRLQYFVQRKVVKSPISLLGSSVGGKPRSSPKHRVVLSGFFGVWVFIFLPPGFRVWCISKRKKKNQTKKDRHWFRYPVCSDTSNKLPSSSLWFSSGRQPVC